MNETFHDVITSCWEDAKDSLTTKQRRWGKVFIELGNPKSAEVARKLRITRAASAKMKWRVLEKLMPFYEQYSKKKNNDDILDRIASMKEKRILNAPDKLIKRRGQKKMLHLKADEINDKRLGRSYVGGYSIKEITSTELAKLKDLPKKIYTTHKASPLAEWWKSEAEKHSKTENISYTLAHKEQLKHYSLKWQRRDYTPRLCRFCRCLLPIGEIIPNSGMGRVTTRRKYCSNFCKTSFKRLP